MIPLLLAGCGPKDPREINIGFIGPLTGNAIDLGIGPAKAMELAVEDYNERREADQPKVNLFVEDDAWLGVNAVPKYEKLRQEKGIEILFMNHTDGTIALQQKALDDHVTIINALNNDQLLSGMNENTFMIGKKTEEAAQVVSARIVELGLKKVAGFHVDNSFMTISAKTLEEHLEKQGVQAKLLLVNIDKENYEEELARFKADGCDVLVFFGYKNLGYAMKQARAMGIEALFFSSTTIRNKEYSDNSGGAIVGTEFPFFTANDGNYIIARQFLERYGQRFGKEPFSAWPAMQAYDAMNIALGIIGRETERPRKTKFNDWLRAELHEVNYFQGVCGNLAIMDDGSSRGIYFSLYVVKGNDGIEKVKR